MKIESFNGLFGLYILPNYFQNAINYAVENNRMKLKDAQAFFNLKRVFFLILALNYKKPQSCVCGFL